VAKGIAIFYLHCCCAVLCWHTLECFQYARQAFRFSPFFEMSHSSGKTIIVFIWNCGALYFSRCWRTHQCCAIDLRSATGGVGSPSIQHELKLRDRDTAISAPQTRTLLIICALRRDVRSFTQESAETFFFAPKLLARSFIDLQLVPRDFSLVFSGALCLIGFDSLTSFRVNYLFVNWNQKEPISAF